MIKITNCEGHPFYNILAGLVADYLLEKPVTVIHYFWLWIGLTTNMHVM